MSPPKISYAKKAKTSYAKKAKIATAKISPTLKKRILRVAYLLTPQKNTVKVQIKETLELIADLYGESVEETTLTLSHSWILKWSPRSSDYAFPADPINSGLSRVVLQTIRQNYRLVVLDHFNATGHVLVDFDEVQKFYVMGRDFHRKYWYLHNQLTKEQAFTDAEAVLSTEIQFQSQLVSYFKPLVDAVKKKDLYEDMATVLDTADIVGNNLALGEFGSVQFTRAQTTFRSYLKYHKVKTPNRLHDVTPVLKNWLLDLGSHDKEAFKKVFLLTVRLSTSLDYYTKKKYPSHMIILLQKTYRVLLATRKASKLKESGNHDTERFYPEVEIGTVGTPTPWRTTTSYRWKLESWAQDVLDCTVALQYGKISRASFRAFRQKLQQYDDSYDGEIKVWLLGTVKVMSSTEESESSDSDSSIGDETVEPGPPQLKDNTAEGVVAYYLPTEEWATAARGNFKTIMNFVNAMGLNEGVIPTPFKPGNGAAFSNRSVKMAVAAEMIDVDTTDPAHLEASLKTWLPPPYQKLFEMYMASCQAILVAKRLQGKGQKEIHIRTRRSIMLVLPASDRKVLFRMFGSSIGKQKA